MNEENEILQAVFYHTSLKSITLDGMLRDGCFIDVYPVIFPNLEKLNLLSCTYLSDSGLQDILKRCGSNLRELIDLELGLSGTANIGFQIEDCTTYWDSVGVILESIDLSRTRINGIGFEEGVNSLPNLEILRISDCSQLTDTGLQEILRISGSKSAWDRSIPDQDNWGWYWEMG